MPEAPSQRIRVLVVDDSALVRKDLPALLSRDPDIEVVGTAIDPFVARTKILSLQPDVVLLDYGLPRMDGLTFLKKLMEHWPLPVILMSGLVTPGSDFAIEAIEAGAVDVVLKPEGVRSIAGIDKDLIQKIKLAHKSFPKARRGSASAGSTTPTSAPAPSTGSSSASGSTEPGGAKPTERRPIARAASPQKAKTPCPPDLFDNRTLIVMGGSTGGTEAMKEVLTRLPFTIPPIAIVQHIPPVFSKSFAMRLNDLCPFEVHEAVDGETIGPGTVVVAPGGKHLELVWTGSAYKVRLHMGPEVHYQRPAVDLLFKSAAACNPTLTVGVLLTGMGRDGAVGLKELRDRGARTFAQDRESCVVFGMPGAAMELGAAERMVALTDIAGVIQRSCDQIGRRRPNASLTPA